MLIFEIENNKTSKTHLFEVDVRMEMKVEEAFLRKDAHEGVTAATAVTDLGLPNVSELQVVRHYTKLSQKNFSIDTHFYPLGSCTMKYNPKITQVLSSLENFTQLHPYASFESCQGTLFCLYGLQRMIANITGMSAVSLTPMAGSQGEFAGISMIKAYHVQRGDFERQEIIVPDCAHGTNPATAAMCGYQVIEIKTGADGDIDLESLSAVLTHKTAGIMLTNPSTLGLFERQIVQIADMVHKVGGLLYYDGANLNAIMGKVRPGDMGFDVMHLNLHKTFATPHGGGGPGAGPIAVNARLKDFLPSPIVVHDSDCNIYRLASTSPDTIGCLSTFHGNVNILLRAYMYMKLLGADGMQRVSEMAVLNANYLMNCLKMQGFNVIYEDRRATHEFVISFAEEKKQYGITALGVAKALLDYGFHAPTMYFPLMISECFLIEPTETENKATMDAFILALSQIVERAKLEVGYLNNAPQNLCVRRVDEVNAAKQLNVVHD